MHDFVLVEQNRKKQKAALRCAQALRFLHIFVLRVRLDSFKKTKNLMLLCPRFIRLAYSSLLQAKEAALTSPPAPKPSKQPRTQVSDTFAAIHIGPVPLYKFSKKPA